MLHNKDYYITQFSDIISECSDEDCQEHQMLIEAFQIAIDRWITYHRDSLQRFESLKTMSDDII